MENLSKRKPKRVSVSFVGDNDVVQHIIPLEKENGVAKKDKAVKNINNNERELLNEEDDSSSDDGEKVYTHSKVLSVDSEVAGKDVYSFHTPKRKKMTKKDGETNSGTPKSILKKNSRSASTPVSKKKKNRKIEATTPYRLGRRNKVNYEENSSSDDSYSDDDSDTESINENLENRHDSQSSTLVGSSQQKNKRRLLEEITTNTEEYFEIHSGAAGRTSDRTLARLETPRMDQEMLSEVLQNVHFMYEKERRVLLEEHCTFFKLWMYQMCNGYNLLLHGLGSKKEFLEEFRNRHLKDLNHIVINGYFPSITIKSILNAITEDILEHSGGFRSNIDQCEFIRKKYESERNEDIYLVINNIDGSMLRAERVQMILSLLAKIRGFHIIASIDHINAPLIWDQGKASNFNWLWHDVTTYCSYAEETSYENSLLVQQTGGLALSSLTHVMRSLTPNAKGVFMILVQYQLENQDNPSYNGLSFPSLYQKCREAFLVNSDLTLRTQLTEFRDHKLITFKKLDGMDILSIPLDDATLMEFIEQQKAEET